jgi:hypothetical protein
MFRSQLAAPGALGVRLSANLQAKPNKVLVAHASGIHGCARTVYTIGVDPVDIPGLLRTTPERLGLIVQHVTEELALFPFGSRKDMNFEPVLIRTSDGNVIANDEQHPYFNSNLPIHGNYAKQWIV